ncbi:MAG: branched-chain amino acid ABC transporter permease [Halapricum sp.]
MKSETTRDSLETTIGGYTVTASTAMRLFALLVLLAFPALFGNYYTGVVSKALVLAIFAIGVDLIWGYTGVLTFGHAAFFGLGAYLSAKLLTAVSFSGDIYAAYFLALVVAGGVALAIAGVLFYRGITGSYFTIITLALAIIAQQAAVSLQGITGGYNGIAGVPSFALGIPFVSMVRLTGVAKYYALVVITLLAVLFALRVTRSPFGRAIAAIKDNEAKARALGYDTAKYKTLMFGLSAALAGLSGGLYATVANFVSPPLIGFVLSTQVLVWVLVGGRGTVVGAVVGAVLLTLFENVASGVFQSTWTLLLGVVLVLVVLVFPEGFIGVLVEVRSRVTSRQEMSE